MLQASRVVLELDQQEPKDGRRLHFFAKGEEIPLVSQGIWQVGRGIVQLSTLCQNGEEVWLGWAEPSTFFGQWFSHLKIYQATALSDVHLTWFSLAEINASPRLTQIILPQAVRRMRQTEALLAIAEKVLPANRENHYLYGMIAFGLEQCHRLDEAEAVGRMAVAMDRNDPWAQHAVAHVMEMQGRLEEGIAWNEKHGGKLTVLSMGTDEWVEQIRRAGQRADQREHRLHVDPRRRHQRVGDRLRRVLVEVERRGAERQVEIKQCRAGLVAFGYRPSEIVCDRGGAHAAACADYEGNFSDGLHADCQSFFADG